MGLDKSKHSSIETWAKYWALPAIFIATSIVIMLYGESGKEWEDPNSQPVGGN